MSSVEEKMLLMLLVHKLPPRHQTSAQQNYGKTNPERHRSNCPFTTTEIMPKTDYRESIQDRKTVRFYNKYRQTDINNAKNRSRRQYSKQKNVQF